MQIYKNVKGSYIPETNTEILDTKVFVYHNIKDVIHKHKDIEITEYEFDMIEYTKDEYIQSIKLQNNELTEVVADLIGGIV